MSGTVGWLASSGSINDAANRVWPLVTLGTDANIQYTLLLGWTLPVPDLEVGRIFYVSGRSSTYRVPKRTRKWTPMDDPSQTRSVTWSPARR
jgi:hypothetical protein